MARDEFKTPVAVSEFNGGLVTKLNAERLQLPQSPDLLNVDFIKKYSIRKRPSFRELGTDTDTDPVDYTFSHRVRRFSEYLWKAAGAKLKVWNPENSAWYNLTGDLTITAGLKWDSAPFQDSRYMGNGTDPFMRWNGAQSKLNGAALTGATTITLDDASFFNTAAPSGSTHGLKAIVVDQSSGTPITVTYTGVSGNQLTGVTGVTQDLDDNSYIYQHVETYASNPKGNIYNLFGGRLIIAGQTSNPALVYYSKPTDQRDFTGSGSGAGGNTTFPGAVRNIESLFDSTGTATMVVSIDTPAYYQFDITDPTGATVAAFKIIRDGVSSLNNAATPVENDLLFVDDDGNIRTLGYKELYTDVRTDILSDLIEPTVQEELEFDTMAAAYHKRSAYIACRSLTATANDVLLVFRQEYAAWSLWRGVPASCFAKFGNVLHFGSNASSKVYYLTDEFSSDIDDTPIDFRYTIGDVDFDRPLTYKTLRRMRIGGLISANCQLEIKLIYDRSPVTSATFIIDGASNTITSPTLPEGTYGIVNYGAEVYGGSSNGLLKSFVADLELTTLGHFEMMRVSIENAQADTDFEISRVLLFPELDDTSRIKKSKILRPD